MSISSSIIGSMGSINTALTAMGVSDIQAKQEKEKQKAAALSASQEVAKLRQTRQDTADLVKQARDMSKDTVHAIPREAYQAHMLGQAEMMKDAEGVLRTNYPELLAKARKAGMLDEFRVKLDMTRYLKDLDKMGYEGAGSFEAYHRRESIKRSGGRMQYLKKQAGHSLSDFGNKILDGLYGLNQYEEGEDE